MPKRTRVYSADRLYQDGLYSEAFQRYRLAASQGCAQALQRVGMMHYLGQGAEHNLVDAYAWTELAVQRGFHAAVHSRAMMGQRLSASDLERAKRRVDELRP